MSSTDLIKERKERDEKEDLKHIMKTEQGRRFVWRLLGFTGVYRSFEGETNEVMRQLGKRDVGLFLLAITSETCEDESFKMMREAQAREKEEKEYYERSNKQQSYASTISAFSNGDAYESEPDPEYGEHESYAINAVFGDAASESSASDLSTYL